MRVGRDETCISISAIGSSAAEKLMMQKSQPPFPAASGRVPGPVSAPHYLAEFLSQLLDLAKRTLALLPGQ